MVIYPTDYQFYSKCNIGEPCDIYINVYGYESASFTLIAATDGATRTILDGVAYLDAVPAKEYAYYSMTVLKASTPVTFTLSPQVGDPDMYDAVCAGCVCGLCGHPWSNVLCQVCVLHGDAPQLWGW